MTDLFPDEMRAAFKAANLPFDPSEKIGPTAAIFAFAQSHEIVTPPSFTAWVIAHGLERWISPKQRSTAFRTALARGWIRPDPTVEYKESAATPGRRSSGNRRKGYRTNIYRRPSLRK